MERTRFPFALIFESPERFLRNFQRVFFIQITCVRKSFVFPTIPLGIISEKLQLWTFYVERLVPSPKLSRPQRRLFKTTAPFSFKWNFKKKSQKSKESSLIQYNTVKIVVARKRLMYPKGAYICKNGSVEVINCVL